MSRYIESGLAMPEYAGWQLVFHQFFQNEFQLGTANPEVHRKRTREFTYPVIEERRTYFERMRHAHPVYFAENVIGKIVMKIESKTLFHLRTAPYDFKQFCKRPAFRLNKQ